MIGTIISIICIGIIISILTEQMVIRRLRMSEGVEISRGRCHLKPGYDKIPEKESNVILSNADGLNK
jgi:hypothetical protein